MIAQRIYQSFLTAGLALTPCLGFATEPLALAPINPNHTILTAPIITAPDENELSYSLTAGWTSKYITEGIDCLPDSSIWEISPTIAWKDFTFSAWYASGVSESYEEVDLVLSYTIKVDKWTFTPWYEHQIYFTPDYNVANPAVTVSYSLNDWLTIGLDTQWKIEHQDMEGYYDIFLQSTWEPIEQVSITPLIRFGYNSGYNVTVDDGANCIDYSVKATWTLNENLSFSMLTYYTQAVSALRHADLTNEFAYGVYVNISF